MGDYWLQDVARQAHHTVKRVASLLRSGQTKGRYDTICSRGRDSQSPRYRLRWCSRNTSIACGWNSTGPDNDIVNGDPGWARPRHNWYDAVSEASMGDLWLPDATRRTRTSRYIDLSCAADKLEIASWWGSTHVAPVATIARLCCIAAGRVSRHN